MKSFLYMEQLAQVHGFTLDELQANRVGLVHPMQLARGSRIGLGGTSFSFALGTITLLGGLLGAYLFYSDLGPNPTRVDLNAVYLIGGAGVLISLAFFVGTGVSLAKRNKRKAAFASGRISMFEGPLQKIHIRGRGGRSSEYIIKVSGCSFHTSSKLFGLLTQGALYRFYFVDDQLLSFEIAAPEA